MRNFSQGFTASPAASWVSMANWREVAGVGVMADADDGEGVTVQLRKATDASGSNAADLGSPVTVTSTGADTDVQAIATAVASDLGNYDADTPFTHVSAQITAAGSPAPAETATGVLLRGQGRFI